MQAAEHEGIRTHSNRRLPSGLQALARRRAPVSGVKPPNNTLSRILAEHRTIDSCGETGGSRLSRSVLDSGESGGDGRGEPWRPRAVGRGGTVATLGACVAHAWQQQALGGPTGRGEATASLRGGEEINQTLKLSRELRARRRIAAKKYQRRFVLRTRKVDMAM